MKLQKLGGYASIVLVCLNIVTAGIMGSLFQGLGGLDFYDPAKMMAAYNASPVGFLTCYVLSILTSILILLVTMALQERMRANAPNLMHLAVIAASISLALVLSAETSGIYRNVIAAQLNDASTFRVLLVLHESLYFAGVSAFGCGFLLIGWAILRTGALSKMLGYIVLAFGLLSAGRFATSISPAPIVDVIWMVAGLIVGLIASGWLGVALLRKEQPQPAAKTIAASS